MYTTFTVPQNLTLSGPEVGHFPLDSPAYILNSNDNVRCDIMFYDSCDGSSLPAHENSCILLCEL